MSDKPIDKNSNSAQHSIEQDAQSIEQLYNTLDKVQSPDSLNANILAAAQQAIEADNTVAGTHDTGKNQAEGHYPVKRPAWLRPMAAAAMMVLVVGVSWQQIFDPAAPLAPTYSALEAQQEADLAISNNELAADYLSAERADNTLKKEALLSMPMTAPIPADRAISRTEAKHSPVAQRNAKNQLDVAPQAHLKAKKKSLEKQAAAKSTLDNNARQKQLVNAIHIDDRNWQYLNSRCAYWSFVAQQQQYYYLSCSAFDDQVFKASTDKFVIIPSDNSRPLIDIGSHIQLHKRITHEVPEH